MFSSNATQVVAASTPAEAVDYDSTNDYLSRSTYYNGYVNALTFLKETFTFSCWFYNGESTGNAYVFSSGASSGNANLFYVNISTTTFQIAAYDGSGTFILNATTTNRLPLNTFCNVLISIDMTSTSNRYVYVNDQLMTMTWSNYVNSTIQFGTLIQRVNSLSNSVDPTACRISNVFLDFTYRDLSITANRRLFVTADLKPAAGQAALNPILYLPMSDPTTVGTNAGTGGNFTLTGTVARSGRGPNQYNAPYSDLDGAADYVSRTTAPTGIADGRQFTLHCVITPDALAAASDYFVVSFSSSTAVKFRFYLQGSASGNGSASLSGLTSSGVNRLQMDFPNGTFVVGRNYVIDISIDLNSTATRHVYVNGQSVAVTYGTYTNSDINFLITTTPRYYIGAGATPSNFFNGKLGALWFNTSYIDLSVATNLAKFVSGTGIDAKPVDLGATGELPTGTAPIMYLPMYGNNAGKNYGTGGDFTVNSGPYTGARGPNEFWGNKTVTTNGYLNRTSALSGVSDGNKFSLSFWFRPGVSGTNQALFSISTAGGTSLRFFVFRTSANALRVYGRNSAGTIVFDAITTGENENGFLANNNYYVQIGIDLSNAGSRSIYVNGVSMASTTTWTTYNTAGVITFSQVIQAFMSYNSSGTYADLFNGQLSEFYFTTDYIDFSQEANRLKFRDCFGNPTDLPSAITAASVPTPAVYMRFPPTSFGTNSGTGGNFTVNGTITDGGQL